jgi:amidohydrolase
MEKVLAWIDEHANELIATYKELHSMPEIGFNEFKTSAYLADKLKKAGYEVQEKVGGTTGVIGILHGREPGMTFALRADMDALPIEEKTGLPFASTHPGVMHACGHDSHSAMVLYAAKAIAACGGIQRGTLKIVFQPAEELLTGAMTIIKSGALQDVDEIVGIHMRNNKEALIGEATPAIYHAACCHMDVLLHGKAAHSAWLHRGINVIDAVAAIVNATNAIHEDPGISHSVKITRCIAGKAFNIIPDTAELSIDLRSTTNEVMGRLQEKVRNAVLTGAASVGATAEITVIADAPAAQFDDALVSDAASSIKAVLGEGKCRQPVFTPGSEDFHCFSVKAGIKGAFIGLGGDMTTGGHTPTMSLDLSTLPGGAKILAHLTKTKLG